MKIPIFQIDAFAHELFRGNPAAVCPLDQWLSDNLMQKIAAENNLSETAFFVKKSAGYELRWFTPTAEVDLCGHATLASAYVISSELKISDEPMVFYTRSGELRVNRLDNQFTLDFPSHTPVVCDVPNLLLPALGIDSAEVFAAEDYVVLVDSEAQIRILNPDFSKLKGLPLRGVVVTAKGEKHDFVSRWFGPNVGVNEDPVTGSAHCALAPFWAKRLGKKELRAQQISARGGEIFCRVVGDRVLLTGSAVCYLRGEIHIDVF